MTKGAGLSTLSRPASIVFRTRTQTLTPSVAFVTASYRLDRDRCALLSRSLEACAPSYEHWIVVDRGDLPLFRSLEDARTTVVAKEEVLPRWVHRLDTLRIGLRSNVWVQAGGRPIRGWLLQQLVKLAVAREVDAEVLVHADSDVVLLRPFSTSSVVDDDGRIRLYARPDTIDERLPVHVRWHRSAERLLGVEPAALPLPDFISSLVPWKRRNAVALLDHIEETTGRHWLRALAGSWHVSEYTLYGRFAQDVLGDAGGQFASAVSLCSDYYKHVPLTAPELKTLLDRAGPDEIAVSLTSKAGMKPEDYVEVLEPRWESLARPQPAAPALPPPTRPRAGRTGATSGRGRAATRMTPARLTGVIVVLLTLMLVIVGLGID